MNDATTTNGKIFLVGFGPGAQEHMTFRARAAIAEAQVVIGYSTYIKLVEDLLVGKEVIRKGMTEELDRCTEAYEHALRGKTVALISSGDIGIYGMAGPTFEVLLQSGWRPGSGVEVEVIPGATALTSCAALVGAPLTHDFCSISLSDLLTPWPVIARRLEAAARGDFVVALYNPKSGRRTGQIVEAQRILLQHRSPDTPVAVVKSAYRNKQAIQMTQLAHMADCQIGMLTTVIIGNSSTFTQDNLMITPRGYANKYQWLTGETHAGEKAGRSLTMGLTGWKACVRRYLRTADDGSVQDVARHFDVAVGDILAAIAEASAEDHAGPLQAEAVAHDRLEDILLATRRWGRLRASVRAGGTVSEMLLHGSDFADGIEARGAGHGGPGCAFERRAGRLNVINEHFHLHIDWQRVTHAWFVERLDTTHGVYFTDERGNTVFNLSLAKHNGAFDTAALEHYRLSRNDLGANTHYEAASNA